MEQNQTIASNHATFFRYAKLLLRFTHENPKGQKYLIGGIEKTVESYEATLLPKVGWQNYVFSTLTCSLQVPHIFKELFEEDILEEEVIFEWAKKVDNDRWKRKSSPF